MTNVRSGARRKWTKWGVVFALLLSLPTYMLITEQYYDRIVRFDMMYSKTKGGLSDADLERVWNQKPLTSTDIEGYLHDATLVGRSRFTPKAVKAIYAGRDHNYFEWVEGQPTSSTGHWGTKWKLEHDVWGTRSKWQIVQVFCFDVNQDEDSGYCIVANDYSQIFSFDKPPRRIPGNPLGIRTDTKPPADLAARAERLGLIDATERDH